MKESGIEKLIRYLLESKGDEYKEEYYEWYRDVELEQNIDSLSELKPFIKWLVENDKIDYKKLREEREDLCDVNLRQLRNKYIKVVSLSYVKLLMLLAIQDKPIDFLISILK